MANRQSTIYLLISINNTPNLVKPCFQAVPHFIQLVRDSFKTERYQSSGFIDMFGIL